MMESLVTEWDVPATSASAPAPILPNVAPSNVYPTADGQLILIAANQDSVFAAPGRADGPARAGRAGSRYADHVGRGERPGRSSTS